MSSLRDKGAGQQADQADRSAAHCCNPAAEDVGEDADDGRAEEDHPHGEGAHPRCRRHREETARANEPIQKPHDRLEAELIIISHSKQMTAQDAKENSLQEDYLTKPGDAIIERCVCV